MHTPLPQYPLTLSADCANMGGYSVDDSVKWVAVASLKKLAVLLLLFDRD